MNKNDRNGVRTAQDLERKYDIKGLKKEISENLYGIKKVDKELTEFIKKTVSDFSEMQAELDGKIETWFYSGEPTLINEPASGWEDLSVHVGDLYYDTDTGIPYRFKYINDAYIWEEIRDKDTAKALAAANAAKDTADSKRRIFTQTPAPPYDKGDLWFNNKEIYICVDNKTSGEYVEGDFTIATSYTEKINAVAEELSMVKADYGEFRTITADQINSLTIIVDEIDAAKVDISMANIDKAWINDLLVKGSILTDDINAATGSFSMYLTGANIVGDNIVGHTITADKIIIRDPSSDKGVLYEINNGAVEQTELTEEEIKRLTLDGKVITANSITADKINVTDLFSQNITSTGEFRLGGSGALYYDPETDSLYLRANAISIGTSNVATQDDVTISQTETLKTINKDYATKEELAKEAARIKINEDNIAANVTSIEGIVTSIKVTESGIEIGKSDSEIKSVQDNDSYAFIDKSGTKILELDTKGVNAPSVNISKQLKIGDGWAIRQGEYVSGKGYNLNDVWIGG